jgi:HK97 gp10 family phage protein
MSKGLQIKLSATGKLFKVKGNNVAVSDSFEKRLTDKTLLKKDLKEIAFLIKEKITKNIITAKTYKGGNVARLKPSTIKRKGNSRPLFETGKLSGSVIVTDSGNNVIVRMAKKKYAKKQANTEEVAKYLNQGTPKMVARPFFGITKKDLTAFVNSVMKDFTKVRPSTFKQTVKSANRFINSR